MTKATSSIPFSVWRKIAMATWRPRKGPMIAGRSSSSKADA